MATLTGYKKDQVGYYIEKDPDAVLDYAIDWTTWLDDDTIATSTWTIETISGDASPLAKESALNTNYVATVILQGGTVGNIYNIKNTITTGNGYTDVRNFRVKVQNRQVD